MSSRKATRTKRAEVRQTAAEPCFNEMIYALPIAGTGVPKPCPFCGDVECVGVVLGVGETGTTAHVECGNCGAEMGGACFSADLGLNSSYAVVQEACRLWNERATTKEQAAT